MNSKFKFLEHKADVKFQAWGNTLEKAFTNSALALKETIAHNIKVKPKIKEDIVVQGNDLEALLYNFLEEILFLLDAKQFLLSGIKELTIKKSKKFNLKATLIGDSTSNYKFTNDVKAITYNSMFVKKEKNKYICQVVVDV
jgi:SHS2 domain-containing protein